MPPGDARFRRILLIVVKTCIYIPASLLTCPCPRVIALIYLCEESLELKLRAVKKKSKLRVFGKLPRFAF